MKADLVLINGLVTTFDDEIPLATAVACLNGRIVKVGSLGDVRDFIGDDTLVLDVGGRRVTPGLIDGHMHLLNYAVGLSQIDLVGARSGDQILRLVAERSRLEPPGAWVVGRGWDQECLDSVPTREQLDRVAPGHPVLLVRVCGHAGVANTLALDACGMLDGEDAQRRSGIVCEEDLRAMRARIPGPSLRETARLLVRASNRLTECGITSIHSNDGTASQSPSDIISVYREAAEMGMSLRISWDFPFEMVESLACMGFRTGSGDESFSVGAAKIFVDGSLGNRTAALSEPYADCGETSGILLHDAAQLRDMVRKARKNGFQVAMHAIGDRAVEACIDALEQAGPWSWPAGPVQRPRVVHCQVMRPDLFRRMARCCAVADVQPRFVSSDHRFAESRLGVERSAHSYAWRTFAAYGIPVAFGSDCPVEPPNPMLGVYAGVTRCDEEGQPRGGWQPGQKLSVEECLRSFTVVPAWEAGEEKQKGSISAGKVADIVVWDEDLLQVADDALKDIEPYLVIIDGKVVHSCEYGTSGTRSGPHPAWEGIS